jgi:hypothetical protein
MDHYRKTASPQTVVDSRVTLAAETDPTHSAQNCCRAHSGIRSESRG